jgi:TPR repeat protein
MRMTKKESERFLAELKEKFDIESKISNSSSTKDEIDRLEAIAEAGSQRAEYDIGMCYLNGTNREANKVIAFRWFDKCREHASADLQVKLCYQYFQAGMIKEADDCVERGLKDDPDTMLYAYHQMKAEGESYSA